MIWYFFEYRQTFIRVLGLQGPAGSADVGININIFLNIEIDEILCNLRVLKFSCTVHEKHLKITVIEHIFR